MATGNFKTMADFPLIVKDDMMIKYCPHCEMYVDAAEKCGSCGADLTEVESGYDEVGMDDFVKEMEEKCTAMNNAQPFYKVSVESGYYCGVQFYVEENYYNLEKWDNVDCRNELDMCRSEMLRKYKAAGNMIRRELGKARKELGMMELGIAARFSNGETIYTKIA
jgi:hypothetical protein